MEIFIPAYNAEKFLHATVSRLPLSRLPISRIRIINDGSTDKTQKVAEIIAQENPLVEVYKMPQNCGYGAVVKKAIQLFLSGSASLLACIHADGQYAPEKLPDLFAEIQKKDVALVQGSRIASGKAREGGMPWYKYWGNRFLTTMENICFGLKMTDYHSGYLLYKRSFLHSLLLSKYSDSFDIDLQLIASACSRKMSIAELDIPTHYGEETSHLNSFSYGMRCLRVMWKYKLGYFDEG